MTREAENERKAEEIFNEYEALPLTSAGIHDIKPLIVKALAEKDRLIAEKDAELQAHKKALKVAREALREVICYFDGLTDIDDNGNPNQEMKSVIEISKAMDKLNELIGD